jgi:hypothetical protein
MKIRHSAVKSNVFKLVSTFEFDLEVDGHFIPTRIELFQDTERRRQWRCRMWERELYHMRMTLPRGKTRHPESDEELLVERTWELSDRFEDFGAPSAKSALRGFLDNLRKYLGRVAA